MYWLEPCVLTFCMIYQIMEFSHDESSDQINCSGRLLLETPNSARSSTHTVSQENSSVSIILPSFNLGPLLKEKKSPPEGIHFG